MPAMLGFSMNEGRPPGTEVAALTEAEDDRDEEEETAVAVLVVGEEEEEEVGTLLAPPPKPNRSGYMLPGSPN